MFAYDHEPTGQAFKPNYSNGVAADVEPMQLNTDNISDRNYWRVPGAWRNAVINEPFHGDFLANVMTGAMQLRRLGAHPEN